MFIYFVRTAEGFGMKEIPLKQSALNEEEKLSCVPTVNVLLKLSKISWEQGLYGMSEEAKKTEDNLIITASEFLLNESIEAHNVLAQVKSQPEINVEEPGKINIFSFIRSEHTFKLLYNLIAYSQLSDIEMFKAVLIMEAMLCIQIGMNTSTIRTLLMMYFGLEMQEDLQKLIESF